MSGADEAAHGIFTNEARIPVSKGVVGRVISSVVVTAGEVG